MLLQHTSAESSCYVMRSQMSARHFQSNFKMDVRFVFDLLGIVADVGNADTNGSGFLNLTGFCRNN